MAGYIGAKVGTVTANAADIKGDISATDTTPEITLKNTTETDADGSRGGKITFKGEQSGGEESTLANIQASHDGSSDDEKGDLIFRTNDGSDGASPTEAMRIDSSGNVGIGTTDTNGGRLVVGSAVSGDTSVIQLLRTGVTERTNFIGLSDSDALVISADENNEGSDSNIRLKVDGSEAMRIDSSGNLMVKNTTGASFTANAATDLSIGSGSASAGMTIYTGTSNQGAISFADGTTGDQQYRGFITYTHSTDFMNFGTAGSERMRIDSSGNVGIGTSSPDTALSVVSSSTQAKFEGSSQGNVVIEKSGTEGFAIFSNAAGTLGFYDNNGSAERMRIDSNGRLHIGATAYSGGYVGYNFMMRAASPMIKFESTSSNNTWDIYNASGGHFYFGYNGSDKGNINNSTGNYTALSDVNKKKDFENSDIGLEEVLKLQPKLFRMIDDESDAPKHLGFIAQDVQPIIPQSYVEETNNDRTFIGLQDRPIIAALTKAVQELNAKIETLETKVAALEAE